MSCHFLLQGISPTQGSNPGLPNFGWILYQLSHKESPRILDCVAYPFLQRIFPTQEWNLGLLHCRWILYRLSYQGGATSDFEENGDFGIPGYPRSKVVSTEVLWMTGTWTYGVPCRARRVLQVGKSVGRKALRQEGERALFRAPVLWLQGAFRNL